MNGIVYDKQYNVAIVKLTLSKEPKGIQCSYITKIKSNLLRYIYSCEILLEDTYEIYILEIKK